MGGLGGRVWVGGWVGVVVVVGGGGVCGWVVVCVCVGGWGGVGGRGPHPGDPPRTHRDPEEPKYGPRKFLWAPVTGK